MKIYFRTQRAKLELRATNISSLLEYFTESAYCSSASGKYFL